MALPQIALVGATGNLGPAILKSLVDASLRIKIFTRAGSAHKISELTNSDLLEIREVDYKSQASLISALDGVDVVISTLGFADLFEIQKSLIDASLVAGVSRFIPSEFGNDSANELVRKIPIYADKIKTQEYLEAAVSRKPAFSYTMCYSNSFFDWQLQVGFMVNLKAHTATLYDGGDVPFSATRLSTIGTAVVAVIKNLDITKNKHVYFHDAAVTQNQLIDIAKSIDGEDWVTKIVSTAEVEKDAYRALSSGNPTESANAALGFIARSCWGAGYGGDFSDKISNKELGIPEMSMADIEALVKGVIASNAN